MIRRLSLVLLIGLAATVALKPWSGAKAAEGGFSGYGLGGAAFGAGETPAPGTYVSFVGGYYAADMGGAVTLGGELFELGLEINFLQTAVNGVVALDAVILGGRPAISVTVPAGYVDLAANVGLGGVSGTREVDGVGLGDASARLQLGWQRGDLSYLVYVQANAPTGRYDAGFQPNIGLNRPALDIGTAWTWTEKASKLQFNAALGFTFNAENDETDYKTGNEFHLEWAVGREISQGLLIGIVGYNYRQITGDSGEGAVLGPFKGRADAIGAGLVYTTMIDATPLVLNLRHYEEFNVQRRWEGGMTFLTGTIRF